MVRTLMLLALLSGTAISGCSCTRRHELPLKPGMPEDEVSRVLIEHGYTDVPSQWHSYVTAAGQSRVIAVYRPTRRSRRFVVIDWRLLLTTGEGDGLEALVLEGLVLDRFACSVSRKPYVSTPLEELRELLDARETIEDED